MIEYVIIGFALGFLSALILEVLLLREKCNLNTEKPPLPWPRWSGHSWEYPEPEDKSYRPNIIKGGYQPDHTHPLDDSNPPQGGSGLRKPKLPMIAPLLTVTE